MKETFQTIDDRLLLVPIDEPTKTRGGIALPDTARHGKDVKRGRVLDVGPGLLLQDGRRAEMQVKPGNEVIFPNHQQIELENGDEKLWVVSERQVLVVIRK